MKTAWIKLSAILLALLGFTSCGIARKTDTKEEQPSDDNEKQKIEVRPQIRVMYGPPPASFRTNGSEND